MHRLDTSEDRLIAEALLSQFVVLMFQFAALRIFQVKGTSMELLVIIPCVFIVGLFFLRAFKAVFYRNGLLMILSYLLWGIIFCSNMLMFPGNKQIVTSIISVSVIGIPSFIYSYSINNYNVILSVFKKSSRVLFIVGLIILCLILFKNLTGGIYAMGYSYYMLIPCLYYTHDFFDTKKLSSLFLMFICLFSIVVSGSRGPILSWIILVFLEALARFPLIYTLSIASVGSLIYSARTKVFLYLFELLSSYGIYSRTLALFSQPNITLSNRDVVYNRAVSLIANYWFTGVGIAGDKRYLGMYPHNLFLEILVHFGVILGGAVSLFLIFLIVKSLSKAIKSRTHRFLLIVFCLGIVPLMFSSSYIGNAWFWVFVGFSLKVIKQTVH